MKRATFLLKIAGDRPAAIAAMRELAPLFAECCEGFLVENFSMWHIEEYIFGYGECKAENMNCFDNAFAHLPAGVELVCAPGTMRLMYHDIGVVREDKSLIRHRVFGTRIKPGCEEEYKARHDALIAQRGDAVKDGPDSDFTIWYGDGCIFGYCEKVRAYDHEPTEEERASTIAWETRQLEIMDWMTDDVDWMTGETHAPVERVL